MRIYVPDNKQKAATAQTTQKLKNKVTCPLRKIRQRLFIQLLNRLDKRRVRRQRSQRTPHVRIDDL